MKKNSKKLGFTPLNSAMPTAKRRYLTGFTLIEILVVVAIIGVLATIVIINLVGAEATSRDGRRKADMKAITSALDIYYDQNNVYATDVSGFDTSKGQDAVLGNITGSTWGTVGLKALETAYIDKLPIDPKNTGDYFYLYEPAQFGGAAQFGITCNPVVPCAYMLSAKLESEHSQGYDPLCDQAMTGTDLDHTHNYCVVGGGAKTHTSS